MQSARQLPLRTSRPLCAACRPAKRRAIGTAAIPPSESTSAGDEDRLEQRIGGQKEHGPGDASTNPETLIRKLKPTLIRKLKPQPVKSLVRKHDSERGSTRATIFNRPSGYARGEHTLGRGRVMLRSAPRSATAQPGRGRAPKALRQQSAGLSGQKRVDGALEDPSEDYAWGWSPMNPQDTTEHDLSAKPSHSAGSLGLTKPITHEKFKAKALEADSELHGFEQEGGWRQDITGTRWRYCRSSEDVREGVPEQVSKPMPERPALMTRPDRPVAVPETASPVSVAKDEPKDPPLTKRRTDLIAKITEETSANLMVNPFMPNMISEIAKRVAEQVRAQIWQDFQKLGNSAGLHDPLQKHGDAQKGVFSAASTSPVQTSAQIKQMSEAEHAVHHPAEQVLQFGQQQSAGHVPQFVPSARHSSMEESAMQISTNTQHHADGRQEQLMRTGVRHEPNLQDSDQSRPLVRFEAVPEDDRRPRNESATQNPVHNPNPVRFPRSASGQLPSVDSGVSRCSSEQLSVGDTAYTSDTHPPPASAQTQQGLAPSTQAVDASEPSQGWPGNATTETGHDTVVDEPSELPRKKKLSLVEELFPDKPEPEEQESMAAERSISRVKPPTEKRHMSVMTGRKAALKEHHGYESLGQEPTVLLLRNASTSLEEEDFRRLIPKGQHIQDWQGQGQYLKVIPGRNLRTLERESHYYIIFPTRLAAQQYQHNVGEAHRAAQRHTQSSFMSSIPPAPGQLINGLDVDALKKAFSLIPTSQTLQLNLMMQPYGFGLKRMMSKGELPIFADFPHKHKVLLGIDGIEGHGQQTSDVQKYLHLLGKERGLAYELVEADDAIKRLDMRRRRKYRDHHREIEQVALSDHDDDDDKDDDAREGDDTSSPPAQKRHTEVLVEETAQRWVISFISEAEAKRFVRASHGRRFPIFAKSAAPYERPGKMTAEYLW